MSLCDEILNKKDITETLKRKNLHYVEPAQPFALPDLGKFIRVKYNKEEEILFYKTAFERNVVVKIFDEKNNMFFMSYDKLKGIPKRIVELISHMEASGFLETDVITDHKGRSKLLFKMSDDYKKALMNGGEIIKRDEDRVKKIVTTELDGDIILKEFKNGKISLKEKALMEFEKTDKKTKFKSFYEKFRRHNKERD